MDHRRMRGFQKTPQVIQVSKKDRSEKQDDCGFN